MNQAQFKILLEKYSKGSCTPQEQQIVESYFEKFQDSTTTPPLNSAKESFLLENITKSIKEQKSGVISLFPKQVIRIAAAILIVVGISATLSLVFGNSYTQVITANAQRKTIKLDDGSVIQLNAGSSVAYHKDFKENRKIKLTGEAFFEVAKDAEHPFEIITDSIVTTVLGTSFNINAYKNYPIKVSVRTGKVKVNTIKHKENSYYLTPNQSVVFNSYGKENLNTNDEFVATAGWLNNTIILKNTSLYEVGGILEKWYNVKVIFKEEAIQELKINGKFKNENLITVLESITYLENLSYEYLDNKTILIKKN